jgi:hypothetical protein
MSAISKHQNCLLSKDLMSKIYDSLIWRWEKRWKDGNEKFHIDARCFKEFKGRIKLHVESVAGAKGFEDRMQLPTPSNNNWMVFTDPKESKVKSILYHLRNAAAHAHFAKPSRNFLEFKSDNLQGKRVMQGRIEVRHFQSFINALSDTAKVD